MTQPRSIPVTLALMVTFPVFLACSKKKSTDSNSTSTSGGTVASGAGNPSHGAPVSVSLFLNTASGQALVDAVVFTSANPVTVTMSALPADPAAAPIQISRTTVTPDPTTSAVAVSVPGAGLQATDAVRIPRQPDTECSGGNA